MAIMGEPFPGESPQSVVKQEDVRPLEIGDLLQRPEVLRDATYVLLSTKDLPRDVAKNDVNTFLKDRVSGQNQETWESRIEGIKGEHERIYADWKQEELERQRERFEAEGALARETESEEELFLVRLDDFVPTVKDGKPTLETAFLGTKRELLRTSSHWTFNHVVEPAAFLGKGASWEEKKFVYITPFTKAKELNGNPYGLLPEDVWWGLGTKSALELPEGTIVITKRGTNEAEEIRRLVGIEVIEIEGNLYNEAERVMEEKGIRVIGPKEFKGAKRLAVENEAFHGYHLGQNKRAESESYLRAEAVIDHASKTLEKAEQLISEFNEQNENPWVSTRTVNRANSLVQLLDLGYFSPDDFSSLSFSDSEESKNSAFEEVVRAIHNHYFGDSYNPRRYDLWKAEKQERDPRAREVATMGIKMLDRIYGIASSGEVLKNISPYLLKTQLAYIKANFDIIPPNLIGVFMAKNLERITGQLL